MLALLAVLWAPAPALRDNPNQVRAGLEIDQIDEEHTILTYVEQIEKLRLFEAHPTITRPHDATVEWWADADAHRALTRRG